MVQALWIRLRGLDIGLLATKRTLEVLEKNLKGWVLEVLADVAVKDGLESGGGDLVGKEVLALILGKRDWESSSSFNQELLKNFIVSQILGPEEEMKSYYTHCIVAVPSYPICSIWMLDYSTYTLYNIHTCTEYILTFIGCILYTKDCGRTCTWYKDE